MKSLKLIPFDKALMALSIWKAWPASARRMQKLRLLERRVEATRFGVNSPQALHRSSIGKQAAGRRALMLP